MPDLSDDEVRLLRTLVRSYGSVARANAEDEMLSEAERRSEASAYRVCAGLLHKLQTSEERLSAEVAQRELVG